MEKIQRRIHCLWYQGMVKNSGQIIKKGFAIIILNYISKKKIIKRKNVKADGKINTTLGPRTAEEFGKTIIRILIGKMKNKTQKNHQKMIIENFRNLKSNSGLFPNKEYKK